MNPGPKASWIGGVKRGKTRPNSVTPLFFSVQDGDWIVGLILLNAIHFFEIKCGSDTAKRGGGKIRAVMRVRVDRRRNGYGSYEDSIRLEETHQMSQQLMRIRHVLDGLKTHDVFEAGTIGESECVRLHEVDAALRIMPVCVLDGGSDDPMIGQELRAIAYSTGNVEHAPGLDMPGGKLVPGQMQLQRRFTGAALAIRALPE